MDLQSRSPSQPDAMNGINYIFVIEHITTSLQSEFIRTLQFPGCNYRHRSVLSIHIHRYVTARTESKHPFVLPSLPYSLPPLPSTPTPNPPSRRSPTSTSSPHSPSSSYTPSIPPRPPPAALPPEPPKGPT